MRQENPLPNKYQSNGLTCSRNSHGMWVVEDEHGKFYAINASDDYMRHAHPVDRAKKSIVVKATRSIGILV